MQKADVKAVSHNAGFIMATRGMSGVVRAIYALLLARFLGPEIYGFFYYGQSWYLALLPLAALGLDSFISREIGRNQGDPGGVLAKTLGWRTVAALVVVGGSVIAAFLIEPDPYLRGLLLVFSFALFGRGVAQWVHSVFTAFQQTHLLFRLETYYRPLELVLAVVVLLADGGLYGLALVHAAVWWLQGVHGLAVMRREIAPVQADWALHRNYHVISASIPMGIYALFAAWLTQGPLVIYRHMQVDASILGQIALVLQMFLVLSWIPMAFSQAALPVLSRMAGEKINDSQKYVSAVLFAAVLLSGFGAMLAWGVGDVLVVWVFGHDYKLAGELLGFGLLLLLPWSLASGLWPVLVARGETFRPAFWAGFGAATMTVLLLAFSSSFGPAGVLYTIFAGMAVWALGLMWMSRNILGGLWVNHFGKPLLAVLFGCAIQYYLGWWQVSSLLFGGLSAVVAAWFLGVFSVSEIQRLCREISS